MHFPSPDSLDVVDIIAAWLSTCNVIELAFESFTTYRPMHKAANSALYTVWSCFSPSLALTFLISFPQQYTIAAAPTPSSVKDPSVNIIMLVGFDSQSCFACSFVFAIMVFSMGYPGGFQGNLCPYPSKPVPIHKGMGSDRYGSWVGYNQYRIEMQVHIKSNCNIKTKYTR